MEQQFPDNGVVFEDNLESTIHVFNPAFSC